MSNPRKVLLIVADQFRADCVHGSLADFIDLPNIQALRADGVTFTNHYAVASPCGPSRASLLTGQYAMNHRSIRNGTPLDNAITNIALQAQKSGYQPALYGYTDTSLDPRVYDTSDPKYAGEEQVMPGFTEKTEMRFMQSLPWRAHLKAKGYDLPDYSDFYIPKSPNPNEKPKIDDPAFYAAEDSDTAFLTDELLTDLATQTSDNWFAHIAYIRPHPPLVAPALYNRMYDGHDLPAPIRHNTRLEQAAAHPHFAAATTRPNIETVTNGFSGQLDSEDPDTIQTLRSIYFGLATEVDAHIGRIIAFLKDTGQYDDTVIVFTSDHGEMLGDHHLWGKQTVYDAAFQTPLIIRDPDLPNSHGTDISAFTESVDITPTILDLIGQTIPAAMDGSSLCPFLKGQTPEGWRDYVHLELDLAEPDEPTLYQNTANLSLRDANVSILREMRFKLVHFGGGMPPLMYDLESDPHEMQNIADDPIHTATLLRLTQKLLNHKMRCANHTLSDMRNTEQGTFGFTPD